MVGQNHIKLLESWYPKGVDITVSHDPCEEPTGRADVWVTLPPPHMRTTIQKYIAFKAYKAAKKREVYNMREPLGGNKEGQILLSSQLYAGSDQYLYQRPDLWPCFWKGVELAALGFNTPTPLSKSTMNLMFASASPSTFPDSPLKRENNCGFIYNIGNITFNFQALMFQRTYPSPPFNTTFSECLSWFDTHTFIRTIPFLSPSKAEHEMAKYPEYWPEGLNSEQSPRTIMWWFFRGSGQGINNPMPIGNHSGIIPLTAAERSYNDLVGDGYKMTLDGGNSTATRIVLQKWAGQSFPAQY